MNRQLFAFVIVVSLFVRCSSPDENSVFSPDKTIRLDFLIDQGVPQYTIFKDDSLVLDRSSLGLETSSGQFSSELSLEEVSATVVKDEFEMDQGKRRNVSYHANEKTFHLMTADKRPLNVVFRVSNDGAAFRYELPDSSENQVTILKENSSFRFAETTTGFLQPMSDPKTGWSKVNPCYEEFYEKEVPVGTSSPTRSGWVYPALFHSGSNWVVLTEAGLNGNYCGSRLTNSKRKGEYLLSFPDSLENFPGGGVLPVLKSPMKTPWRVIGIGSLQTLIESDLGVALAEKAIDMDREFIKPGQSSWSWALLKDDSTVYDVQKRFIDYAAEMKWEYCLIDTDWDRKIGYEQVRQLSAYAQSKGVGIILWYNSAGSWNETPYTPKHKLLTKETRVQEFKLLNEMGIKGVKIDFFGGDGQSMIQYYIEILEDAAAHHLLINFHGATLPRGWHRTYPNLMSAEAIKGFEYVTFDQQNADEQPSHSTIIPFTRNLFDPMDFTPLSLDTVPRITRRTTRAFELALPVVFLSGVQHFVETPRGMKTVPEEIRVYLRSLPEKWDDSKFIGGYPGKDFTVARKAGNRWIIAGINGEKKGKKLKADLSFLRGKAGYLISESADNLSLTKQAVSDAGTITEIAVASHGGFVMVVEM